MNHIPLDEIVPFGTPLVCLDTGVPGVRSEWVFGDPIRQGGMGRVYELFETRTPFRRAVIKLLRPDKIDDEHVSAFLREGIRLRMRVAGKGTPECYGIGTYDGFPYIIMQRGDSIRRDLGIEETPGFVRDLTESVTALHGNLLCHGDIKPINLCMLNGHPGLLDLGSVRKLIPDGTPEPITRTPGYSAPELAEEACAAPWIDVFGLAVTLNVILPPKVADVFSPAIRKGMDPSEGTRLKTAAQLYEAILTCFNHYSKHRKRTMIARVVTHTLVAGTAVVGTLVVTAERKEHHSDEALNNLSSCEAMSLAHLKRGKIDLAASNTIHAIESFDRAKAYGERAARILRLIEKTK